MDLLAAQRRAADDEQVVAVDDRVGVREVAVERERVVDQARLLPVEQVAGVEEAEGGAVDLAGRVCEDREQRDSAAVDSTLVSAHGPHF